jgi:hypothetical protein
MAPVLDLDPTIEPAGAVAAVAVLGDQTLQPHRHLIPRAAPERFAEMSDSSCTAGAVHTWHFSEVTALLGEDRKSTFGAFRTAFVQVFGVRRETGKE